MCEIPLFLFPAQYLKSATICVHSILSCLFSGRGGGTILAGAQGWHDSCGGAGLAWRLRVHDWHDSCGPPLARGLRVSKNHSRRVGVRWHDSCERGGCRIARGEPAAGVAFFGVGESWHASCAPAAAAADRERARLARFLRPPPTSPLNRWHASCEAAAAADACGYAIGLWKRLWIGCGNL